MNNSTGDWDNTEEDNELDEYAELDVFNWDWFSFCMLNWPIILDSSFEFVSLSFAIALSDDINKRDDLLFGLNESEELLVELVELENNEDDDADDIGINPKLDNAIEAEEDNDDDDGMNELDAPDIMLNLSSSVVPIWLFFFCILSELIYYLLIEI